MADIEAVRIRTLEYILKLRKLVTRLESYVKSRVDFHQGAAISKGAFGGVSFAGAVLGIVACFVAAPVTGGVALVVSVSGAAGSIITARTKFIEGDKAKDEFRTLFTAYQQAAERFKIMVQAILKGQPGGGNAFGTGLGVAQGVGVVAQIGTSTAAPAKLAQQAIIQASGTWQVGAEASNVPWQAGQGLLRAARILGGAAAAVGAVLAVANCVGAAHDLTYGQHPSQEAAEQFLRDVRDELAVVEKQYHVAFSAPSINGNPACGSACRIYIGDWADQKHHPNIYSAKVPCHRHTAPPHPSVKKSRF